jgi:hypothetical protein
VIPYSIAIIKKYTLTQFDVKTFLEGKITDILSIEQPYGFRAKMEKSAHF